MGAAIGIGIFEFKRHKFSYEKNTFAFSPEDTRGRIELNITKCTFLQSRAGQYEQKFLYQYFCPDLRYTYLGILYLD